MPPVKPLSGLIAGELIKGLGIGQLFCRGLQEMSRGPFNVHLQDKNTKLWNIVRVTFSAIS